jgi:hypothetical protein
MTAFPMNIFTENRFRKVGRQINVCSEKCSLAPFCHYYKLKEDSTKKGKKKYLITIARPHILVYAMIWI